MLVVLPTLGTRLDTLATALHSVREQADVDVRVVVVVPRDRADARALVTQAGAEVVDDPGRGLSAAVNAGVAARLDEELFAWLGDDDLLEPRGLRTLVTLLDQAPHAVVAYGGCRYIDPCGRLIGVSRVGRVASAILGFGPDLVPQPASLTRLSALTSAGDYDESLHFAMDLDMFLRLRRRGPFVCTREEVASFRWHADSLTVSNRALSLAESEKVKHRYLSPAARGIAPLWDLPVRAATHLAARRVSALAERLGT